MNFQPMLKFHLLRWLGGSSVTCGPSLVSEASVTGEPPSSPPLVPPAPPVAVPPPPLAPVPSGPESPVGEPPWPPAELGVSSGEEQPRMMDASKTTKRERDMGERPSGRRA